MTDVSASVDYASLFAVAPSPYVVLDEELTVVAANAAALRLARVGHEEFVGRPLFEVFPSSEFEPGRDTGARLRRAIRRVLQTGEPEIAPFERYDVRLADGSFAERYWSSVITAIDRRDALPVHVAMRVEDITDFVRASSHRGSPHPLRRRTDTLGADVFARAQDLQELNDRLRRTNDELAATKAEMVEGDESQEQFLATLAHELRNPLAAIRGALDVLSGLEHGRPQAAAMLGVIERQTEALTRMTDDLLEASRARAGKLTLDMTHLELGALAAAAVEARRTGGGIADRAIELSIRGEVWLDADSVRLTQAIDNLLGNAIKFTNDIGTIRLSVRGDGAQALIEVSDDGFGFDPERAVDLLRPFSQQGGPRHAAGVGNGLGLGLTIVQSIAQAHGGTLAATSRGPNTGATFTLNLPTERAASDVAEPVAPENISADGSDRTGDRDVPPSPTPNGPRILLIEDAQDTAVTIRAQLEQQGHVVAIASTGEEGISGARDAIPDVILCDIGLPGIDGYAVAAQLRADEVLGHIPLIAISGYGRTADRTHAFESGFDLYLLKPFTGAALEEAIRTASRPGASHAPS